MDVEFSKTYDPDSIEKQADEIWLSGGYFHPEACEDGRKAYTIVIPPPNVTAALHLGHALNNTLQDILIRFRRMQQFKTLWMPGTDHAGIATQTVVEKRILSEEGKKRKILYLCFKPFCLPAFRLAPASAAGPIAASLAKLRTRKPPRG